MAVLAGDRKREDVQATTKNAMILAKLLMNNDGKHCRKRTVISVGSQEEMDGGDHNVTYQLYLTIIVIIYIANNATFFFEIIDRGDGV